MTQLLRLLFILSVIGTPSMAQVPRALKSIESEVYRQEHTVNGPWHSWCVPNPPHGWDIVSGSVTLVVLEIKNQDLVEWHLDGRSQPPCFRVLTDGVPLIGASGPPYRNGLIAFRFNYQIKSVSQTIENNLEKLPDSEKYQKALADASVIEPHERMPLQALETSAATIQVASLKGFSKTNNNCNFTSEEIAEYKRNGVFVFQPNELLKAYESRKGEFSGKEETRLKQLLGLRLEDPYKCFFEIEVDPKQIIRPSLNLDITRMGDDYFFLRLWGSSYPFTGLGYTCDWYYGDGCHYGLSEFNVPPNKGWITEKSYTISEYLALIVRASATDKPKP